MAERVANGQIDELLDGGRHHMRAEGGAQPASIEHLIHFGRDEPVGQSADIASYLGNLHAGHARTYASPKVGATLPGHLAAYLTDQAGFGARERRRQTTSWLETPSSWNACCRNDA